VQLGFFAEPLGRQRGDAERGQSQQQQRWILVGLHVERRRLRQRLELRRHVEQLRQHVEQRLEHVEQRLQLGLHLQQHLRLQLRWGDDAGSTDPLAAARAQCVQIINQDRATLKVAALTQAPLAQEMCVDGQAQADYAANTPHSAFGECMEYAQDECPGWPGPPSSIDTGCLAQMWAEGPPPAGTDNHWLNMSNAQYTTVACGFYQDPAGTWWATQDFW